MLAGKSNKEYVSDMNKRYEELEEEWNNCDANDTKKWMSWQYLAWCKRIRDRFDNEDLGEKPQDDSVDKDNWIDVDDHEEKWNGRVSIWRVRFNEYH